MNGASGKERCTGSLRATHAQAATQPGPSSRPSDVNRGTGAPPRGRARLADRLTAGTRRVDEGLQGRQRVLRLGALANLIGHCFRRLILLNGHGGLIVLIQPVIVKVRQRHRPRDDVLLLRATYCGMGMAANVSRSPIARARKRRLPDHAGGPGAVRRRESVPSGDVWWMVKTTCPL